MDVPSTVAGTVREVLVQLGSRVGEGALLIKVEAGATAEAGAPVSAPAAASTAAAAPVVAPAAADRRGR
jgi:pyruvate/2-oxoglutarate dehydrogenase complex dihydrolipoamide acyltransferase (E2) component